MHPEDMTTDQLEDHLESLEAERMGLELHWMVEDVDNDWDAVNREIKQVKQLLESRRTE
ncbi:hypothetical protein KHQ84_gp007 [Rhodococcus phage Finch]|uniref:Uncharacterized protein n=1 Tax=Rhodococcus phage Finch TaxID=2094144 RepID=A0A2P1JX89_9CAUD|nr:hypothetical protein KHQ84_gp007 [Rhodococcus phage Finch]AVO24957.1 hypothetical protein SEA_FINCH_7 [Rhodococcus phage Finch]